MALRGYLADFGHISFVCGRVNKDWMASESLLHRDPKEGEREGGGRGKEIPFLQQENSLL